MSDSTEIAKSKQVNPLASNRFEPEDFTQMQSLCKWICQSGLTPDSVENPQDAMIIIMRGASLGLPAMQALDSIHVIKGKPTLSADLQVALALRHPECERFQIVEWTEKLCTYETKRRGHDPQSFTFTMEDAHRAGLVDRGRGKSNWQKYPKQMLRARAGATLARAVYPELFTGVYTPEEARSIDAGPANVVSDADTPSTDDLNQMLSEPEEDPGVVDAEFEEATEAKEVDAEEIDVATQNRRIGQMIRHTDDLDTDDTEWVRKAMAATTTHGDFDQMDGKSIKLLVDTLGRKSGDAVDGEPSGRRRMLEGWLADGADEGEQDVFV